MPKVSVIIPAYNAMAYLPETVESVLHQTLQDFEILIVNDGSRDRIEEWATTLTDPRIKLITQANAGVSVARNTGIAAAQGDYIAFLDADDLWEPTKLEKQAKRLDEQPEVGLVYTWTLLVTDKGEPTEVMVAFDIEGDVWEKLLVQDMMSNCSSAMVRRSCFDEVGVFDPSFSYCADRDMWTRIASRYHFAAVKEPLTLYRRHPSSMSKNQRKTLSELRQVIEKSFQAVPMEKLYLRNRTYGWMNLFAAWGCLEHDMDCKEATYHYQQALLHYPAIRYTPIYIRLRTALFLTQWFGPNTYGSLRELTRSLRRQLRTVTGH
ncbi:glycosyltransferase family 2 protein [Leptolyngbya sp. AN02str]|uniref:glycosyltransferase family 2 protein n=1 Tax=Leptolyngbya sp. AN02str TaxID=3423363 RepID=UPI003D31A52B